MGRECFLEGAFARRLTQTDEVILLTNRLDLSAEVVAALYELRGSVKLFFCFLKPMLGCRRLFSTHAEGAAIQVDCALLACLLLARAVGRTVTSDDYRMFCFYLQGWADEQELLEHLKRKPLDGS